MDTLPHYRFREAKSAETTTVQILLLLNRRVRRVIRWSHVSGDLHMQWRSAQYSASYGGPRSRVISTAENCRVLCLCPSVAESVCGTVSRAISTAEDAHVCTDNWSVRSCHVPLEQSRRLPLSVSDRPTFPRLYRTAPPLFASCWTDRALVVVKCTVAPVCPTRRAETLITLTGTRR